MKEKAKSLSKHPYVCYTLAFVVMCAAVFSAFIYSGKSLVWNWDGLEQHFLSYTYYGRYLRMVLKTVFIEHSFSIPSFCMSIGYGSDILSTLSYYAIGDPICALTVFVPTRFMVYFYDFAIVLRLYLAGVSFLKLCFYLNSRHEEKFSKTAVLVGAFVYVFCGFALFASVRHPYFMNPMIYFPMVLLGAEKILDKKKPYVFIFGVFLSAVSNFYFFYMIVILTVLYVAWRLIFKFKGEKIKKRLCFLGKIAGFSILGTAMGAVTLLPTVWMFFQDARSETGYVYNFFYTIADYQKSASGFISADTAHDWLFMGYASVSLLSVFILFMQRKRFTGIKAAFIGMAVMMSLPVVGSIMNGGSYVANRWVFGFSLLVGYIIVIMWDRLFAASVKQKVWLLVCLCAYFVLCMLMTQIRTVSFFVPMFLAGVFLCIVSLYSKKRGGAFKTACVLCVFANIALNAMFVYSPRFGNYVAEFANNKNFMTEYEKNETYALKKLTKDDEESFSRYSGSTTRNKTLYCGLNSTQYYWSLSNGNITDFQQESGLNYKGIAKYSGLDSRTALSTLSNVKYYVKKKSASESKVPYGFESIGTSMDCNASDYLSKRLGDNFDVSDLSKAEKKQLLKGYTTKYEIYENQNFLPFGYTYGNYITRESYDELNPAQKEETMLQAVVLEDEKKENEIEPEITGKEFDYSFENADGVRIGENSFIVSKNGGKITLEFLGEENSENYLYITGLDYEGVSPMQRYDKAQWAVKSTYEKNNIRYSERFWEQPEQVKLSFYSQNTEGGSVSTDILYRTPYRSRYSDQHDYLVSLYYDESPRRSITITFPEVGTYTYDDIKVLCQPMDEYESRIGSLKEETLQNVDFHDDNAAFATNEVTGEISLNESKYLLLTIPYSSGWTAYVDGEECELLKANTMYMALNLGAGDHEIKLEYETPGKIIGTGLSLISILAFALFFAVDKRRDISIKRRKKKHVRTGN